MQKAANNKTVGAKSRTGKIVFLAKMSKRLRKASDRLIGAFRIGITKVGLGGEKGCPLLPRFTTVFFEDFLLGQPFQIP